MVRRKVNIYKFSNHDNKLILLLRKGFYPYKYIDDWKKLNETTLPKKEHFYSHLNTEDVTDADVTDTRTQKEFVTTSKYKN